MNVRRILVALDGSRLAETIVPAACSLAETLGAELVLVHVLEREPPREVHGEPHLRTAEDARRYLGALGRRLGQSGTVCETSVVDAASEDVAVCLDMEARRFDADLIAMCAHGRTNLRGRLVGRIAERTLRRGSIPILLRTARRPEAPDFDLRNLLTPVELGHDVDAALDASRTLAAAYGATVTLLSVPEPGPAEVTRLLPAASALAHEFKREDTRERLAELAERLSADVADVRPVVVEGRPADAILAVSESLPADLVVLVTHARTGLSSWYDPGTANQLLAHPDLTLLLLKQP